MDGSNPVSFPPPHAPSPKAMEIAERFFPTSVFVSCDGYEHAHYTEGPSLALAIDAALSAAVAAEREKTILECASSVQAMPDARDRILRMLPAPAPEAKP